MSWATYVSLLLLIGIGFGVWSWFTAVEEYPAIDILASREIEQGLPVYAQFMVAQKLRLPKPIRVKALVVPVYLSSLEHGMRVDLRTHEELLGRWYLPTSGSRTDLTGLLPKIYEARLSLGAAQPLEGDLEVSFMAPTVTHEDASRAARLFVEPDDSKFPEGNYRISQNEKSGDVSLQIIAERTRLERFIEAWHRRALRLVFQGGVALALAVLLLTLPQILHRTLSPEH